MKKLFLVLSIIAGLLTSANAAETKPMKNYRAVDPAKAQILQKGEGKNFCPICGMTLPMFYKTNHAAKADGEEKQYCSIHCMIEDKEINDKNLTDFKAVDNDTMKFKSSKEMYFVVGSKQPGTMSPISKYGFGTKEGAQKFADKFGGKIMKFDELYAYVKKGLQKDIDATKKRQAKAAGMGKKIYAKMCKQTEKRFSNPADAKTYLQESKLCGKLKGKKLQAVALYLSGKGKKAPAMKCGGGKCGK
jgi:nitrous oxide reductase accessory protein NosL